MPGRHPSPAWAAACIADSTPPTVSWSVTESVVTPAVTHAATSSSGEDEPSDAVVCR